MAVSPPQGVAPGLGLFLARAQALPAPGPRSLDVVGDDAGFERELVVAERFDLQRLARSRPRRGDEQIAGRLRGSRVGDQAPAPRFDLEPRRELGLGVLRVPGILDVRA